MSAADDDFQIKMVLENIKSLKDLKLLPNEQLPLLAREIRNTIIEVVGKNGGHLASNLGVVELTITLHRVFDSPQDAIIFDVSHQCYAHKILTGRYKDIFSLRTHSGLSGFTRRNESKHDFFNNGHSSTSISQGLGLLTAWQMKGKNDKVVAVIGDGALTGGMAFEALSHAGQLNKNLIVILNDNQMSISENTGALSRYLSSLSISPVYQRLKRIVGKLTNTSHKSKSRIGNFISRIKRGIKGLFQMDNVFTDLGFEYVGPLNGHFMTGLEKVLEKVKKIDRPVVIHVRTKKGLGYSPAENDPASFHGIGPFLITDGKVENNHNLTFTQVFAGKIESLAQKNPEICAITAAMAKGTGLENFSKKFPGRFFDVGIAEEHAVTFASGLSAGEMIPFVAIYSTFIQRSVDQIIHDVALPGFKVVICLDRAGIVPGDGSTHQGVFDISLLRCIPNLTVLCPESAVSLEKSMEYALACDGPVVIRYPKLNCPEHLESFEKEMEKGRGILIENRELIRRLTHEDDVRSKDVLFICTGGIFNECEEAAKKLFTENIFADIYALRFIKPLDESYFVNACSKYKSIVFVEDGVESGGISEYLYSVLLQNNPSFAGKAAVKAFPDKFLPHGSRKEICEDHGMSGRDLALKAMEILGKNNERT